MQLIYCAETANQKLSEGRNQLLEGLHAIRVSRGFLAAALRPGMRAVSVPVTSTSDIAGFVLPGDQVDILITHQLPSKGDAGQHKAAETILHDVRVIAVDQKLETKSGETVLAHTATLEVTPKQSEVIALANEMG